MVHCIYHFPLVARFAVVHNMWTTRHHGSWRLQSFPFLAQTHIRHIVTEKTLSPQWTDERNKWCSFAFCSHICFGVISADTRQSEISTFHLAALSLLCGIFLRRHHLSTVSFFWRYFSCFDSIELIILYFNYKFIGKICESGSVFSFVPMMPFGGKALRLTVLSIEMHE